MSNLFKSLVISAFYLLTIFVIGCNEDEEASAYDQLKPSIVEISVEEGLRGTSVTLNGINLEEVNKVIFGNQEATFTATETTVTATVPEGVATGELNIAVYSPHGSDRIAFMVISEPKIAELSLTEGFHGDEVIITGAAFGDVSIVKFGDVEAEFTSTETTIITYIPAEASFGEVGITLTNEAGSSQTAFTILDDPFIVSFFPESGQIGDEITITGINFMEVKKIFVGEIEADFVVNSVTDITFIVPEGALNGVLTVEAVAGTSSTEDEFIVQTCEVLPFILYDDSRNSGWQDWGWNSDRDWENKEQPLTGNNALKVTHTGDGWGAVNFYSSPAFNLCGYEKLKLSVYGGPGTEGAVQNLWIKDGSGKQHTKVEIPLKEGAYVTHEITMSELGNPPNVAELFIQNNGVAGNVFYIDDVILE